MRQDNYLIQRGLPCTKCQSSDALAEYSNNFYCFSCHNFVFKKKSEVLVRKFNNEIYEKNVNNFYNKTLPNIAKAYLYKYHFTDELIDKLPIYWCDDFHLWSKRIDFSCGYGQRLVYKIGENMLEARSLDQFSKVKFLSEGPKDALINIKGTDFVVLVEDILSYFRLSQFVSCVCIRGTHLKLEDENRIKRFWNTFYIWLDGDNAGKTAADKIKTRLSWSGYAKIIYTEKDPKCYSDEDIQALLAEVVHGTRKNNT